MALFSAYQAILASWSAQILMLQKGLNKPELLSTDKVLELAKVALQEC
jgi:hypothetical protein